MALVMALMAVIAVETAIAVAFPVLMAIAKVVLMVRGMSNV